MSDESEIKARLSSQATKLHFFYVVLILSAALVLLATQNWTTLTGFTDYLSVAATITSLVLGVLAIIYSFVSSNSTNNFLGSVEASAREVKTVGSDLREVLSKGQELQAKAEQRNDELHRLVGSLRTAVDGLSANTNGIAGAVETIPAKIDALKEVLLERPYPRSTQSPGPTPSVGLDAAQVAAFLSICSVLGLAGLKALCAAQSAQRACDLGAIFKGVYTDSYDYVHGFLICASCLSLIDFKVVSAKRVAKEIFISERVAAAVELEWSRREAAGSDGTKESLKRYGGLIPGSLVELPIEEA